MSPRPPPPNTHTHTCSVGTPVQNGTFFGLLLQAVAYALLFTYYRKTSQDGWDTAAVVFNDVVRGNTTLTADLRRSNVGGGPVPPPKDTPADFGAGARYYGTNVSATTEPHSNYYEDPHI